MNARVDELEEALKALLAIVKRAATTGGQLTPKDLAVIASYERLVTNPFLRHRRPGDHGGTFA